MWEFLDGAWHHPVFGFCRKKEGPIDRFLVTSLVEFAILETDRTRERDARDVF